MAPKASKEGSKEKKQKKPFHVKREDLDLPAYIEEQNSKKLSVLFQRLLDHTVRSSRFRLYVVLQLVAAWLGWGQLMLIVGLGWMMVANTGKRKEGEMSAYSLFNKGVVGYVRCISPFATSDSSRLKRWTHLASPEAPIWTPWSRSSGRGGCELETHSSPESQGPFL